MSENTNKDEGLVDPVKLQERIAELEATNGRLLNESKDHKIKANEYKSKLDIFEKETIDKSGDLQKQLDYERNRNKSLEEKTTSTSNLLIENNIRSILSKVAPELISIDDIINLKKADFKAGIDKDSLTISEDFAKSIVDSVKKDKPHWFKIVSTEGVDTTKPKTTTQNNSDFSAMSSKDIKAAILKSN